MLVRKIEDGVFLLYGCRLAVEPKENYDPKCMYSLEVGWISPTYDDRVTLYAPKGISSEKIKIIRSSFLEGTL